MRLTQIFVNNYKSLRRVRLAPGDLCVIVGANAAGKTNLADSIDFLSEVYRHGLEVAVARKGGYENMAFRRMRRSKGAIGFEVEIEITEQDTHEFLPRGLDLPRLRFLHTFSFGTKGSSIRAEFSVISEQLVVHALENDEWHHLTTVSRDQKGVITIQPLKQQEESTQEPTTKDFRTRILDFSDLRFLASKRRRIARSELFATTIGRYTPGLAAFVTAASAIRVFQISPTRSREYGVPLPRPELAGSGANLPAVVDLLKRTRPREWRHIIAAMRAILPNLRDISVDYTSMRTLGLLFDEHGVGRPWSVGEVSDGTIQTLALLVAIFDSRFSMLVIEEPENSVHPWIIRRLMDACAAAAGARQIVLTTHSPLVLNSVPPESVYVLWRQSGETHLGQLAKLDPDFLEAWKTGKVPTFEYLDSGAVPEALPPGPEPDHFDKGPQ